MLEAGDVQPKCKEHSESAIPPKEHWLYQKLYVLWYFYYNMMTSACF